jgi:hypothetical protein
MAAIATWSDRAVIERRLALMRELVRRLPIWRPLPGPQTMAYESKADIVGYGGAAGGGKTDLAAGLILTCSERAAFFRREKAQTEGVIQRLTEILGNSSTGFNSTKGIWRIPDRGLCEFGGLDNLGDERRWQGRPHDKKIFDEVTEMREKQVRFVMGWNRSSNADLHAKVLMTFNPPTTSEGRWVIEFYGPWLDKSNKLYPTPPGELRYAAMLPDQDGTSRDMWLDSDGQQLTGAKFVLVDGRVTYDFDPADFTPEQIIEPKSRTFIPAKLTDNPYYMASGYMSTLQSLPEPLRSQMLYGDFDAGVTDNPWQVIPTAWVKAAQARWVERSPRGEMLSMGVDVARGGQDKTLIGTRHKTEATKYWFDRLHVHPGANTPSGNIVAGLVIGVRRDHAPIHIDVIGVGASPYDVLNEAGLDVYGVNVSEKATALDKSGRLSFLNMRSQLWWQFRELLDPEADNGVALPPDKELEAELCAPIWGMSGMTIQVESREDIVKRVNRSPDRATAVILAAIDTPKIRMLGALRSSAPPCLDHDPYSKL